MAQPRGTTERVDALSSRAVKREDPVQPSGGAAAQHEPTLAALRQAFPNAPADEQLLHRLIAGEMPIHEKLEELKLALLGKVYELIESPGQSTAAAKLLREVARTSDLVSRRIEAALATTATLRAQRRFLRFHDQGGENHD